MLTVKDMKNTSVSGLNEMTVIKNEVVKLTPENEKGNCVVSFILNKNYKKLFITYSYSPKILTDEQKTIELIKENLMRDTGENWKEYNDYSEFIPLKNLITLSVESPCGLIGAAHRQANEQRHEISEEFASHGFIKSKIIKGQWNVVLNVHAVVTDNVKCEITIEAEEEAQ